MKIWSNSRIPEQVTVEHNGNGFDPSKVEISSSYQPIPLEVVLAFFRYSDRDPDDWHWRQKKSGSR
jgi:hypothetical protein